jgi:chemotaxis protein methyltransferase CheR
LFVHFNSYTLMHKNISETEMSNLLEAVYQEYGYDFRQYSKAHIARRLLHRMSLSGFHSLSEIGAEALHNKRFASQLLQDLSITVTEMFRDPAFYVALREKVVPLLHTYSFIKIWHAGCATGEEVYSMAILLKEEGLYDRSTIYATDFNQQALETAKEGIIANERMKDYSINYQKAGGKETLSEYYTSHYGRAIMDKSLKKNIVWANHNLVTDGVFAEVHLVLCRNVLIYFEKELQNRVHHLFCDSLINGGILCLGSKESLRFTDLSDNYAELDKKQRIFKKKYDFSPQS